MGNKLRDEDLNLNIIVNGDKGKKELGDLEKSTRELTNRNKELRTEKEKLIRAGKQESDEYKRVTAEITTNNKAIKTNEARMTELRKQMGLAGLTMQQLRSEQTRLSRLMNSTTYGTPQWKALRAELAKVEAQMGKVSAGSKTMKMSMGSIANGFNKYFTMATAGIAVATGVALSVKEYIKGMVGLDDALADVMKTTGMARMEVREMYTDFKTFNTRTPRRELLQLAEEAGRLGKKSRQDVMDFVEVANQIKVALGDDLGGEASVAIREVGKLTEIYKISTQYGTDFKESMLKMGSAINEVSANSNAQAPFLIDYLKRLGGIAGQMKISAADTIGYASALDQLGQSQEMAATAQGKLMVDMFKDQAKYAVIAKMNVKDFSNLLETDANEAFLKLLEGLNGNNEGFSVMAEKLDGMGIDGARAVQVLAVLSANTKMVREQQTLANKAMNEGTSLTNEYNIKNNNLAGSVEKVGQFLHSKFINSSFLGWLEKVVGKVSEWTEVKLYDTLQKEQSEINLLVNSITNVNNTNETRNELLDDLQKKYPDFLQNLDTEKLTNEQLAARLKEVNTEYENKILLAIKEDSLTDNYKQRLKLKIDELQTIKDIAKYEAIAAEARKKIPQGADANAYRGALTDQEIQALQLVNILPKKLEGIRVSFADLLQQETELNNAISGLQTKVPGASGSGAPTGGLSTSGSPDGSTGSAGSGTTPTTAGKNYASYLIEDKDGAIDDGFIKAQMQRDMELFAQKKHSEEEWTKFLKEQIEKRVADEAEAFKIEKEIAQARQDLKDIQVEAIGQLASAMAGMFEQGSAAQIAMIAIEKAIAIAQIWINYAKESAAYHAQAALMPFGLGIPWDAAMQTKAKAQAAINTGIVVAQTVASAVSSGKRDKTQAYATGKYPLQTGMYGDKPHYALFNEVPGQPEMVIDGLTTRKLQLNYPEILRAIYQVRDGRTSQYADGKYIDTSALNKTINKFSGAGMDAEQNKILKELAAEIRELRNWRPAVGVDTFEKKWNQYNDIKTKRNMQ